jgi:hypothetical protein
MAEPVFAFRSAIRVCGTSATHWVKFQQGTKCDTEMYETRALVGGFESAVSESIGLARISAPVRFPPRRSNHPDASVR